MSVFTLEQTPSLANAVPGGPAAAAAAAQQGGTNAVQKSKGVKKKPAHGAGKSSKATFQQSDPTGHVKKIPLLQQPFFRCRVVCRAVAFALRLIRHIRKWRQRRYFLHVTVPRAYFVIRCFVRRALGRKRMTLFKTLLFLRMKFMPLVKRCLMKKRHARALLSRIFGGYAARHAVARRFSSVRLTNALVVVQRFVRVAVAQKVRYGLELDREEMAMFFSTLVPATLGVLRDERASMLAITTVHNRLRVITQAYLKQRAARLLQEELQRQQEAAVALEKAEQAAAAAAAAAEELARNDYSSLTIVAVQAEDTFTPLAPCMSSEYSGGKVPSPLRQKRVVFVSRESTPVVAALPPPLPPPGLRRKSAGSGKSPKFSPVVAETTVFPQVPPVSDGIMPQQPHPSGVVAPLTLLGSNSASHPVGDTLQTSSGEVQLPNASMEEDPSIHLPMQRNSTLFAVFPAPADDRGAAEQPSSLVILPSTESNLTSLASADSKATSSDGSSVAQVPSQLSYDSSATGFLGQTAAYTSNPWLWRHEFHTVLATFKPREVCAFLRRYFLTQEDASGGAIFSALIFDSDRTLPVVDFILGKPRASHSTSSLDGRDATSPNAFHHPTGVPSGNTMSLGVNNLMLSPSLSNLSGLNFSENAPSPMAMSDMPPSPLVSVTVAAGAGAQQPQMSSPQHQQQQAEDAPTPFGVGGRGKSGRRRMTIRLRPLNDVQKAFVALLEQTESLERKEILARYLDEARIIHEHIQWFFTVLDARQTIHPWFISLLPHLETLWMLQKGIRVLHAEREGREKIEDEYESMPLHFLSRPMVDQKAEYRRQQIRSKLMQESSVAAHRAGNTGNGGGSGGGALRRDSSTLIPALQQSLGAMNRRRLSSLSMSARPVDASAPARKHSVYFADQALMVHNLHHMASLREIPVVSTIELPKGKPAAGGAAKSERSGKLRAVSLPSDAIHEQMLLTVTSCSSAFDPSNSKGGFSPDEDHLPLKAFVSNLTSDGLADSGRNFAKDVPDIDATSTNVVSRPGSFVMPLEATNFGSFESFEVNQPFQSIQPQAPAQPPSGLTRRGSVAQPRASSGGVVPANFYNAQAPTVSVAPPQLSRRMSCAEANAMFPSKRQSAALLSFVPEKPDGAPLPAGPHGRQGSIIGRGSTTATAAPADAASASSRRRSSRAMPLVSLVEYGHGKPSHGSSTGSGGNDDDDDEDDMSLQQMGSMSGSKEYEHKPRASAVSAWSGRASASSASGFGVNSSSFSAQSILTLHVPQLPEKIVEHVLPGAASAGMDMCRRRPTL